MPLYEKQRTKLIVEFIRTAAHKQRATTSFSLCVLSDERNKMKTLKYTLHMHFFAVF